MMYQCLDSSSGTSSAGAVSSAASSVAASSSPAEISSVSSGISAIWSASIWSASVWSTSVCSTSFWSALSWALSMSGILLYETLLNVNDGSFDYRIHYFEVRREDKHADDHHDGGGLHAIPRRPRHPLHLTADVAQITARIFNPVI